MTISNTLNLADGSTAANLFMTVNIHTGVIESTGKAPVDLTFWRSEADKTAGKSNVWPEVAGAKIGSCELTFTGQEVVKAGANCKVVDTFTYYKTVVATKLFDLYGWNVTL